MIQKRSDNWPQRLNGTRTKRVPNSNSPWRAKTSPTTSSRDDEPREQLLQLGSDLADPLIAELVKLNPTSVRLQNSIFVAAEKGRLPLQRLSEYVAAGDAAADLFMRHVENLGRKTAAELDELARAAEFQLALRRAGPPALDTSELRTTTANPNSSAIPEPEDHTEFQLDIIPAAKPALDASELRKTICEFFSHLTVREALAQSGAPVRLLHGLEHVGRADNQLSDLLLIFPEAWAALLEVRNVGRASLRAGREMLGESFRLRLEGIGLTTDAAHDAEALVFDGVQPDCAALRSIAQGIQHGAESATTETCPQ